MGMIADVIFTIAVVAVAAGAVAEFQFRVGDVGAAAYGAFVVVVCFGRLGGVLDGFRRGSWGF